MPSSRVWKLMSSFDLWCYFSSLSYICVNKYTKNTVYIYKDNIVLIERMCEIFRFTPDSFNGFLWIFSPYASSTCGVARRLCVSHHWSTLWLQCSLQELAHGVPWSLEMAWLKGGGDWGGRKKPRKNGRLGWWHPKKKWGVDLYVYIYIWYSGIHAILYESIIYVCMNIIYAIRLLLLSLYTKSDS